MVLKTNIIDFLNYDVAYNLKEEYKNIEKLHKKNKMYSFNKHEK